MRRKTKAPHTLHLKRETVRQLGRLDLERAVGGVDQAVLDSEEATCPWTKAALTGACGG